MHTNVLGTTSFEHSHVFFVEHRVYSFNNRGHPCRVRMVDEFITIYAISAYLHERGEFESLSAEVYSIQHYVIFFLLVSDLRQVGSFSGYSSFLQQ
jgi:hypothetical protein